MTAREYPERPIVAVGAVITRDGHVVLVRRGKAPLEGEWSLPGGMVELGETLRQAAEREAKEETGLEVEALEMLEVFDSITPEPQNANQHSTAAKIRYHYVLVDFLCRVKSGDLRAGADALDARWVARTELSQFKITPLAERIIGKAFGLQSKRL